LIEVHIAELQQIFNSLDATPFRERDLDPKAEAFIAGWARWPIRAEARLFDRLSAMTVRVVPSRLI
jgi:hypothetical protein